VRLVAPLLAMEIAVAIASGSRRLAASFRLKGSSCA
jgi:hypothetical protein